MAGNQGNNRIVWEKWQINYLKKNFNTMTAQQLADGIGLKRTLVRMKYSELGLKKMELEYWIPEQVTYLRKYYRRFGDSDLADRFNEKWHKDKGWSKKHIEKKRRYLGLKRTEVEKQFIKQRNVASGRFKLCTVHAWDKRGRAPEGDIRFWKNQHNNPIPVIKIGNGFRHWNRYEWEKHHGKIPKGKCVVFKGSYYDLTIDNLELISREEHARRNKTKYHNYPEDLKAVITLNNKFKKLINDTSRESTSGAS